MTHGKMILTAHFDLHRGDVVELCHAFDFREGDITAIRKSVLLVICAIHNSRIPLKYRQSSNVEEVIPIIFRFENVIQKNKRNSSV